MSSQIESSQIEEPSLPQGIGRITLGWLIIVVAAVVAVAVGVYAYSREASGGLVETGLGDLGTGGGAAWGLYVTFVIYFGGVSFAGITIAALIRLFRIERLQGIVRIAELLTVVALILAALSILVDLGQPLRGIVNLFLYARPQSPFFGTFTLVISGYLFASIVYLYLDGRHDAAICARVPGRLQRFHRLWAAGYGNTPAERARHQRTTLWLAVAIIPLLVVATSTLGFVFGLQVGRPGWYSALQAPAFVLLAAVSGLGLIIVIAAFMRRLAAAREKLDERVFRLLGQILMVLIPVYLYFLAAELLTSDFSGSHREQLLTRALLWGEYSLVFWTSVGLLVFAFGLLVWQAVIARSSIGALVVAGIVVNLAAIGKRYLIVVPSQTHGQLLPYEEGSYTPALGELAVVAGLFGLGVLLIALFMKVFPVIGLSASEDATDE